MVDPANIVLDSTTVQPGSAGISIDGEVVSADIANDLFVAGIEVLTGTTSSTLASSTAMIGTAMNGTASPKSTNVSFSGSFAPTSAPAAGTALTSLAGEIAHLAGELTSTYANHTSGEAVSTSEPLSISGVAASSSGSAPLQSATTSSASFYLSSSSLSNAAPATATPNVQANNSQPQSRNTASDSMAASTSKADLIPTGSSTYANSSSGMYPVAGVPRTSQSAASSPQSLGSAGSPSQSASLAPGAMPNTITTGPTLVFPTLSLNPTGSAASSQGMLLVGAIFGITEKAKTLSAIIKDDGPKISFVSEVKGVEDDLINLLEDIHPPGPPPSYEDACLDGGSIFDIFKDLGCLKGSFDEVIADLEDDSPDIPKIQVIFDNIGKLAENLEEEEDDDDDKTASATDGSSASRSSTLSMTSSATSRVSSSTATASMTMQPIDKKPFADPDPSDNSGTPDIADQAFMAFLGDVLSSAVGIGPGPSGFSVVFGSANSTASLSSALISSTTSVADILSPALNLTSAATTSQVIGGESASSQAVVSSTATNASSAQSAEVGTTTQVPTSIAAAVSAEALIDELASIAHQIASSSASAAAVEAASIASLSAATSSPPAHPAPSTQPAKTEWGIFLGLQTYTQGGVDPWTNYYYKIWMTDLTQTPAGPDYCGKENWIANVQINDLGSNYPHYPAKYFDFAIPAGVLQPAKLDCIWQPSPGGSSPGSLSCDPGGQAVLCTNSTLTGVVCKGDNQDRVDPLSGCTFSQ